MTASTAASLCMLAGGRPSARRSPQPGRSSRGILAGLAPFTHTLLWLLWVGLFLGYLGAAHIASDRRLRRWSLLTAAASVVFVGASAIYILPLATGWNSDETWGYGQGHALLAAVSQFGWPAAILAAIGAVAAVQCRSEQDWYWLAWGFVWLLSIVVLPCIVVYHTGDILPLSLGILVLAGLGIARIYEGLRPQSRWAAIAWICFASLLNFPSLVSHYVDGDCYDYRTAASFISHRCLEGDRVLTFSPTLLKHYSAAGNPTDWREPKPTPSTPSPVNRLEQNECGLWCQALARASRSRWTPGSKGIVLKSSISVSYGSITTKTSWKAICMPRRRPNSLSREPVPVFFSRYDMRCFQVLFKTNQQPRTCGPELRQWPRI